MPEVFFCGRFDSKHFIPIQGELRAIHSVPFFQLINAVDLAGLIIDAFMPGMNLSSLN